MQGAQELLSVEDLYCPEPQVVQLLKPLPELFPAGQFRQSMFRLSYFPVVHCEQVVLVLLPSIKPGEHEQQLVKVLHDIFPNGQIAHCI